MKFNGFVQAGCVQEQFPHRDRNRTTQTIRLHSWYSNIAIAGLLGVLLYTLFPYDFTLLSYFSWQSIPRQLTVDRLSGLKDYFEFLLNLLLFGVFSFGWVGVLRQRGVTKLGTFALTLLACTGVGMVTELLQIILPGRHANLLDVLMSGIGGVVGWGIFYSWQRLIFNRVALWRGTLRRCISSRRVAIALVAYSLLTTVAMVFLPTATDFRNWDMNYPLILGNELTGERPWQGAIARLQFFDQALPADTVAQLFANPMPRDIEPNALLAAYEFTPNTDSQNSPDSQNTSTEQLQNLAWNQRSPNAIAEAGVNLSAEHWLQTTTPATFLNQPIQQTNALTLDLIAQPANLTQSGPARIVSLSKNSRNRNLTVGQAGNHLVVRLRTPITGKNGSNPPVIVPQVFMDRSLQHLVLTYANSRLQIYVNGTQTVHTYQLPHPGYKLLYYGWIFIPLGYLLAVLMTLMGGGFSGLSLFSFSGILLSGTILPSLLLEGVMIFADQRSFALKNIGLSLVLMLGTVWLVQKPIQRWLTDDQPKVEPFQPH